VPPFYLARQPDAPLLRTWEVAGTAHADQYLIDYQMSSIQFPCGAVNTGPQHYVVSAAVAALKTWIESGLAPATGDPIAVVGNAIALDANGNALGGVRSPHVDVPIATYSGVGSTAESAPVPP